jgi:hypothetical protein
MAIGIFYTEVIVVVKCAISNWPSGHYFFEDLVEEWSLLTSTVTNFFGFFHTKRLMMT